MNETKSVRIKIPKWTTQINYDVYGRPGLPQVTRADSYLTVTRSRSGTSNPNWRKLIKANSNATTAFSGETREIRVNSGDAFRSYYQNAGKNSWTWIRDQGAYNEPEFVNPASMPAWLVTDADNQALKFIYKRVREARTQFQGLVFLGELNESLRMIKNPLKALHEGVSNYFDALKKRRRGVRPTNYAKRADRLKSILSDTWLEHSFGWVPLISDIGDGLNAYDRVVNKTRHTRLSATGKQQVIIQTDRFSNLGWGNVRTVGIRESYYQATVRYLCGLKEITYGSEREEKQDLFGLTLKGFVPTAWELLPWSFLVDYFANVGEIVEASVTNTSDVTWICKTVRKSGIQRFSGQLNLLETINMGGALHKDCGGSPGFVESEWRTIVRAPLDSLPFPNFQVGIPGRPTQWLNMAALAAKRIGLTPFY